MGPESGPVVSAASDSSGRAPTAGNRGLGRVVHGRDREMRLIGAVATGLDPEILVASGLSGIGKSATVLAALHRIDAHSSSVRVVRSCSARPYAHGLVGQGGMDLAKYAKPLPSGPGYELDVVGLLEAIAAGIELVPTGPRLLFVDDIEVLSPQRTAWLQRLSEAAYERDWRIVAAARQVTATALSDDIEVLDVGPLDEQALRLLLDAELGQPVAADVAGGLLRWSAGNPRIALELADGLSPAQQRGDSKWPGPQNVGPAARRAYREFLDGSGTTGGGSPDRYPLLALLRDEVLPPSSDETRQAEFAGSATTAQAILEGLHLDDVAKAAGVGAEPRAAARAVGVTLLTGSVWGHDGSDRWTPPGTEWTDFLWWSDPSDVAPATRAAGARAALALIDLEHTGRLSDPVGLRADLGQIGSIADPHWVGLCVQVRGCLLLGDASGARRLLKESPATPEGRSVAELVARDLAAARLAMFDGRAQDARAHLASATDLRPSIQDWLPVQGLRTATVAMLEGQAPRTDPPSPTGVWSTRALGEFAVDVGAAHLAVGHVEQAAKFFTIGLERCAWPYRGRAQVRADLVEAAAALDLTHETSVRQLHGLIDPPLSPDEWADPDAAAAHERMLAAMSREGRPGSVDEWLPVSLPPISPWQRLRTLIAYGRYGLIHDAHADAASALRDARALALVAGVPGWSLAIDACLSEHGMPREHIWDQLNEDEREIVRLALHGTTNAQIAEIAYVSPRTVANRFSQIYTSLRVRDRRGLLELANSSPPPWLADQV
ncbi:LuxR C-terminal-related transcriptional regulator [Promicromonospora sp. NPDC057488]|uniref:helix-turn-helix transcriptional regulator n=1 Tax=Promicromonospora sp. NPDC057488 TaxID=3346147 RepID=UPI00366B888C